VLIVDVTESPIQRPKKIVNMVLGKTQAPSYKDPSFIQL
jgi:hypothetical protein